MMPQKSKSLEELEAIRRMVQELPSEDDLLQEAISAFQANFGNMPDIAVCAPGRANLVGDHNDYNKGLVLSITLTMETIFVGKKNGKSFCSIVTLSPEADKPNKIEITVQKKMSPGKPKWANYVKGAMALFPGNISGFDALIVSNIPCEGGVGSSAALVASAYTFLEELSGEVTENLVEKALICQRVENEYAGLPCGIMDQYISIFGKKDSALLVDCRSMETKTIPLNKDKIRMIITNPNIKRELTSTKYGERRQQCEAAAKILKKSLRDATAKDITSLQELGSDTELIRRVRHIVGENIRAENAANAILKGDFKELGDIMVASHNSLRDHFQVSCPEIDALIQSALIDEGVYGSRMIGGGFGGCTITLVKVNTVASAMKHMSNRNKQATFYIATLMDGCHSLTSKLKDLKNTGKPKKSQEQEENIKSTKETKLERQRSSLKAVSSSRTLLSESESSKSIGTKNLVGKQGGPKQKASTSDPKP